MNGIKLEIIKKNVGNFKISKFTEWIVIACTTNWSQTSLEI